MDHSAKALSRIYWQYRNAAKLKEWIDTLPGIAQTELEAPLQQIADILDIDNNGGELLNIAGRIAGIDRPAVPSGSSIPGPLLPDEYFRPVIRAKIARNNSDATIDSIIASIEFITGAEVVGIDDQQNMSFAVIFGETLTDEVRDVLTAFNPSPRPQGVKLTGFIEPVNDQYFGYQGATNSTPYGVAPYASRITV